MAEVDRVKFMVNILPFWTENQKPYLGQPDLLLHHITSQDSFTHADFLSQNQVSKHWLALPELEQTLYTQIPKLAYFMVQCLWLPGQHSCTVSWYLVDVAVTNLCLWVQGTLKVFACGILQICHSTKLSLLGTTWGSKVMNSYTNESSFPSLLLFMFLEQSYPSANN